MAGGGAPLDIAIVGCGPSGMAAALFLSRAGHRITVFERFDAPRPVGAGLLLQPTGLAVLDRLGLRAKVAAAGARIDRLVGHAVPSGRRILAVAYADLDPGLHGIAIHRAALFDALFQALTAESIEVVAASPVVAIEPSSTNRPLLVFASGTKSVPFDLAVDASGAQSGLRTAANGGPPEPFAFGALWTTLPLAGHAFAPATLAQRYRGARRMAGIMPIGSVPGAVGAHAAFFWSLRMGTLAAWRKRGLGPWLEEVAALWPEAGALVSGIDDAERMTPAFYVHFTAKRPAGARIIQIGDAAHSTSPQLGQGANMGLLDAFALSEALARTTDIDRAIAACIASRRRHVRFYQAASRWMTPLFQSDSRTAASVRDLALPAMNVVPYLRRETVRALAGLKTGLFTGLDPADPLAR